MRYFQQIGVGVDVMPLAHALQRQPELWNQNTYRSTFKDTPHREVEDIWIRYPDAQEGQSNDEVANIETSIWHPAIERLPQVKPLILSLMNRVEAYDLCRVLITRLSPGKKIYPHADVGGAYVHMKDVARYHIPIQALPGCVFGCGDEEVQMATGDVWWFNAHAVHYVVNNSADDRIHLLVDVRTFP